MEGYANGREPNTGDTYAQYITEQWIETSKFGKEVRFNILAKNYDADAMYFFITGLCNLLVQLKPKVKNRSMKTDAELEKSFIDFHKKYANDPQKILDIEKDKDIQDAETRKQTIFEIEDTIRSVIEELKITEWGN